MKNLSIDEALNKILTRELSVRQASKECGCSRDFIRAELNRRYAGDSEKLELIEKIMQENKSSSSVVEVDSELLEEVFLKVMNDEMSIKEAQEALNNIDIETLKEKFAELVLKMEDIETLKRYAEYTGNVGITKTSKEDVTKINFRVIAIKMMRNNLSQVEMADSLGIAPRALSREFEKLGEDEDTRLYDLLKAYSFQKMQRHTLTEIEKAKLDYLLDRYEEDNKHLLKAPEKSKTEMIIEKEDFLVLESERLKEQGLTQKEIADKLGTSISSLRRARIAKTNRDNLINKMSEIKDEVEDEVK